MVIISIAAFVSGFSKSAGHLIVLQFFLGLGSAAFIPSSSAIIGDLFPPAKRAKAMSITLIAFFSGVAAGFLISSMLLSSIGWRGAFISSLLLYWLLLFLS